MSRTEGVIHLGVCPRKNDGSIDLKPELDCYFQWHSVGYKAYAEVIKSVMRGREYYAAVRETDKVEKTVKVYAVAGKVYLKRITQKQPNKSVQSYTFEYFEEKLNPRFYNCPASILNLLEEPENDNARQWRLNCMRYAEHQHDMFNISNLPLGSIIEVHHVDTNNQPTSTRFELKESDFQFKRPWWNQMSDDGVSRYVSKKVLKQLEQAGKVNDLRYGNGS